MKNATTRITEIRDALRCAGKSQLPRVLADHLALAEYVSDQLGPFSQRTSNDPVGIGRRLATATSPAEFETKLEVAIADMARFEALRVATAGGLRSQLEAAALGAVNAALPAVRKAVAPTFAKAVAALENAAPGLPAGKAALDAEAVLAEDAGGAYGIARDSIATILTLAGIYDAPPAPDGTTPTPLLSLLPVVHLPATSPREISNASTRVVRDADENKAVRAFIKAVPDAPRLAVLDVARGQFPGLSLTLAEDTADLARRVGNAQRSQLTKAVRTTTASQMVSMR